MYLPFQHLQALLPLQGSARPRMSPRTERWEILCSCNATGLTQLFGKMTLQKL